MSDNIIAAMIAIAGSVLTGVAGWVAARILRREGVVESNLNIQLQGWKDFADDLREQIVALRARLDECEKDRQELWRRFRDMGGDE